ncbi:hypothetical protein AAH979_10180 [Plantactinospora sp. ZYX-F-223]|uniref:hypothetical protein n=1 Tax=Plantactinospora sp. ZYX-F-223 TaxID=3144103 RepID=UPI0031FBA3F0
MERIMGDVGETRLGAADPVDGGGDGRGAADLTPLFELEPGGGQVVVTRFECGSLARLLVLLVLHHRVKRDVARLGEGLIGSRVVVDWRRRVALSVSLWPDIGSVYSMGGVPRHVAAARLPGRLGIRTTCGVFCFAGDWRRVMFHSPVPARSPFEPVVP